jgi:heme/copper-type cytochrome/quinol oxidase subunit 1
LALIEKYKTNEYYRKADEIVIQALFFGSIVLLIMALSISMYSGIVYRISTEKEKLLLIRLLISGFSVFAMILSVAGFLAALRRGMLLLAAYDSFDEDSGTQIEEQKSASENASET